MGGGQSVKAEEQRIAIAAVAKWDGQLSQESMPNYLNDLNSVHAIESEVIYKYAGRYGEEPHDIAARRINYEACLCNLAEDPIHATAAQKCEALLRTLNLWKTPL